MEAMFKTVENQLGLLIVGLLVFAGGLALIELLHEIRTKRLNKARFEEMLASGGVGLVSALTDGVQRALIVGAAVAAWAVTPVKLPVNGWTIAGGMLLVDLVHYWTHRWEHEVRVLWAHHSVHHSSPVYNFSTALRVSAVRALFDAIYYVPLVLLGFHPAIVLTALFVIAVYQIWLHTELIDGRGGLWRVFGAVFCTPAHHRVHHGTEPQYIDKNYGGLLIVWDRLFGTFAPEVERPTYGLTTPLNSTALLTVHFAEYVALYRDLRAAKDGATVRTAIFGRPGAVEKSEKMRTPLRAPPPVRALQIVRRIERGTESTMDEQVYDRVRQLYLAALEQPAEARDAWLDASEAPADVLSEVHELLLHSTEEEVIRPSAAHRMLMESLPAFPMIRPTRRNA